MRADTSIPGREVPSVWAKNENGPEAFARQSPIANGVRCGILTFRENEAKRSTFQRSGKKVAGVCVFAGAGFAVDAGVGCGLPVPQYGLLHRWHVPGPRTPLGENFSEFPLTK